MREPRNVLAAIGTLAIAACAIILVWKGDVAHAMTLAALLVPSAAQASSFGAPAAPAIAVAEGKP